MARTPSPRRPYIPKSWHEEEIRKGSKIYTWLQPFAHRINCWTS